MKYPHWEYFLSIEDDLLRCSRYVDFTKSNFGVYSIEFARILMAASSEFDVVAKEICFRIDRDIKPKNINEYHSVISKKYKKFFDVEIIAERFSLNFRPWAAWRKSQTGGVEVPAWWTSYNRVKHQRADYFNEATLESAMYAVSSLLCGLMYLYASEHNKSEIAISPAPLFLEPKWYGWGTPAEINWIFSIPEE